MVAEFVEFLRGPCLPATAILRPIGFAPMNGFAKRLLAEDDAATMVEYALMVALIAAAAIAVVKGLSLGLNNKFTSVSTSLK